MPSGGSIPGGSRHKRKFRRFQAAIRLSASVLPSHRSSPPRTLPRLADWFRAPDLLRQLTAEGRLKLKTAKDVFDNTRDDAERIRSERDIWRQPTKVTE
jgi:hypothetical protein